MVGICGLNIQKVEWFSNVKFGCEFAFYSPSIRNLRCAFELGREYVKVYMYKYKYTHLQK